jgi:cytoskeletal protein CcmA (bactofilin family)
MAMQSPFFAKRDVAPVAARHNVPIPGFQSRGEPAVHVVPSAPPVAASPAETGTTAQAITTGTGGSKLTVGPNIKLKGVEITDCDTLLVEGNVEATMDSRLMQIAAGGSFKGAAEIDIAEIHGLFDGSLTVRDKLVIHATGRVTGKIRYGKLVVEEGGQLSGEIAHGASAQLAPAAKALLQAA